MNHDGRGREGGRRGGQHGQSAGAQRDGAARAPAVWFQRSTAGAVRIGLRKILV